MTRTAAKSSRESAAAKPAAGYDTDFFAWTQEQARLLREGRFSEIDVENVAEELDSLGNSQKREVRSRLVVVLLHLLKWLHQPSRRSGSWQSTLIGQREEILSELEDSPSLQSFPASQLARAYATARRKASAETRIPLETFPEACPFTIEQILDPDFLPDESAA
jgi:hypothetical protein